MSSSGLDDSRLAVLVHEVRSPVAALSAVAEALQEPAGGDSGRRELLRLAAAACRAIERVVMDAAVASVRVERLDVVELVREAVTSHAIRGSDVEAVLPQGSLLVEGDHVRLRQALDNLVVNALAYGNASPVVVRATRSGGTVRIAVSDAGPGIPENELERVFELGRRLSADVPGSGLGLTLARAIAVAHGGTLEAESSPGLGACFTIVVPAGPQPDTRASTT